MVLDAFCEFYELGVHKRSKSADAMVLDAFCEFYERDRLINDRSGFMNDRNRLTAWFSAHYVSFMSVGS